MNACKCCALWSGYVAVATPCYIEVESHTRSGGRRVLSVTRRVAMAQGMFARSCVVVNAHGIIGRVDDEWMHEMIVSNHVQ